MKPKPTAETSAVPPVDKECESEPDTPPENISPLGRRLMKILQEAEEAGVVPHPTMEEFEQELIKLRKPSWEELVQEQTKTRTG